MYRAGVDGNKKKQYFRKYSGQSCDQQNFFWFYMGQMTNETLTQQFQKYLKITYVLFSFRIAIDNFDVGHSI